MKKSLLVLFAAILFLGNNLAGSAAESTGILSTLKDAIIKDVSNTVQSSVTTAATKALNAVKLAQYKQQLEQKKQELADLEESNINFFSKFFKRIKLNREINNLEEKIKALES